MARSIDVLFRRGRRRGASTSSRMANDSASPVEPVAAQRSPATDPPSRGCVTRGRRSIGTEATKALGSGSAKQQRRTAPARGRRRRAAWSKRSIVATSRRLDAGGVSFDQQRNDGDRRFETSFFSPGPIHKAEPADVSHGQQQYKSPLSPQNEDPRDRRPRGPSSRHCMRSRFEGSLSES